MMCPNCEAPMTLLFGTLYQCPACRLEQYAAAIEAYWAETSTVAYWETDPPADWTPAQYDQGPPPPDHCQICGERLRSADDLRTQQHADCYDGFLAGTV